LLGVAADAAWSVGAMIPFSNAVNRGATDCVADVVRLRGGSSEVVIPVTVDILSRSVLSIYWRNRSETVRFERRPQLRIIEKECFSSCSLKAICIPESVEILSELCFANATVDRLEFEEGS
jgi:hypothetical protein